jgi:hypothetical protein
MHHDPADWNVPSAVEILYLVRKWRGRPQIGPSDVLKRGGPNRRRALEVAGLTTRASAKAMLAKG